jgi:chromosomal replication initiation ATPase DnaA
MSFDPQTYRQDFLARRARFAAAAEEHARKARDRDGSARAQAAAAEQERQERLAQADLERETAARERRAHAVAAHRKAGEGFCAGSSWKAIIADVGILYGATFDQIVGPGRGNPHVLMARQSAMVQLRQQTGFGRRRIARLCGRTDHSTVFHAEAQVERDTNAMAERVARHLEVRERANAAGVGA